MLPVELPLVADRHERADAAANRARILRAARRLLAEQGVSAVSMDAVAAAAGVGKGTIFRRFGSRAGLTHALLDDYMRSFQDAILTGPPPLGPGAPAGDRLEAFCLALVSTQWTHMELALAADPQPGDPQAGAYSFLLTHVRKLVEQLQPGADAGVLALLILGAISPPVLAWLRRDVSSGDQALADSVVRLLRGITG